MVAWGRRSELECMLPYQPLAEILRDLAMQSGEGRSFYDVGEMIAFIARFIPLRSDH